MDIEQQRKEIIQIVNQIKNYQNMDKLYTLARQLNQQEEAARHKLMEQAWRAGKSVCLTIEDMKRYGIY